MIRTSLAVLSNEELLGYMFIRTEKSELEVELEQRLQLALDRIEELEKSLEDHGLNP